MKVALMPRPWVAILPIIRSSSRRRVSTRHLVDQYQRVACQSELCLLEAGGAIGLGDDDAPVFDLTCLVLRARRIGYGGQLIN